MLNAEKFKKEILNIVNDDFYIAVNKNDPNGVSKCGSFPCADCMFSKKKKTESQDVQKTELTGFYQNIKSLLS